VRDILRLTGLYEWYFVLLGAIILAILAWFKYRREVRTFSSPTRWFLPFLRASVVFLLCLILLEPVISQVFHKEKKVGKILIVMDNSPSMSQKDLQIKASRKVHLLNYYGLLPSSMVNLDYIKSSDKLSEAGTILEMKINSILKNMGTYNPEDVAPSLNTKFKEAVSLLEQGLSILYKRKWWELAGENKGEFAKMKRQAQELNRQIDTQRQQWQDISLKKEKEVQDMALRIENLCGQINEFKQKILRRQESLSHNFLNLENDKIQKAQEDFRKINRWERVQKIILEEDESLIKQLQGSFPLTCYTISGTNQKTPFIDTREGEYSKAQRAFPPIFNVLSTDLTEVALRELKRKADPPINAIVLLSDGQHNSQTNFSSGAELLSQFKVPIYPIGVGDTIHPRDLGIIKVDAPAVVEHKIPLKGQIVLKTDLEEGEEISLKIKQEDRVIWEKTIKTKKKERIRKVVFDIDTEKKLKQKGAYMLQVLAEEKEGEVITANNQSCFNVEILPKKKAEEYQLLLVDSSPRWEFRYLKTLLERGSEYRNVSENTFFTKELLVTRFPAKREDLFKFDTLIFGDIPPDWLKEEQKEWIEEFVRMGGGIIFIDGKGKNLGKYSRGPLKSLIPLKQYLESSQRKEYTLKLTPQAIETELFNFTPSPQENARLWSKLLAKPRSLVKVEKYPDVELLTKTEPGNYPVFLTRQYGAGKVFYSAMDETWRWRYKKEDEYMGKFWKALIKWIREKAYLTWDKYVFLGIDKFVYKPGEKVHFRVKVIDANKYPLSEAMVKALILSTEDEGRTVLPLEEKGEGTGRYIGNLASLEPGGYKVKIEAAGLPEEEMKAQINFTVQSLEKEKEEREFITLNWDEEKLKELAHSSGGKYFREENSSELIKYLTQGTRIIKVKQDLPIWQSGWFFSFIVFLLTLEWAIRKRHTLL